MSTVAADFGTHEIVPHFIDGADVPMLGVSYGDTKVTPGVKFDAKVSLRQPTLTWDAEPDSLYAVFKFDPDVPSRADPKFGQWLHWTVVNVPGSDIASGDSLADYVGCGAPEGTDYHRYIFLVYKQGEKFDISGEKILKAAGGGGADRACTSHKDFLPKFQTPPTLVAANFYMGIYDDSVPGLYGWLGGKNDLPSF